MILKNRILMRAVPDADARQAFYAVIFFPKVQTGEIKRNDFLQRPGALMSPTASQQGESIPSISHLVHISHSI